MVHLNIGNILKNGRLRKGLSQTTLAQQLGVNSSSISRWEKNQQVIAGDTLIQAAKILDITAELFPELDLESANTPQGNKTIARLEKKIGEIEKKLSGTVLTQKLQIVIVEKDYSMLLVIQEAIFNLSDKYHVINTSYQDMLSILLKDTIDTTLIVIDMDNEQVKGKQNWHNILKYRHLVRIPKILIVNENVTVPSSSGVVGFIQKPFSAEQFFDVIKKVNLHWPLDEA